MAVVTPDRIEKHILLRAPRARVWQAITSADEFGRWFGVRFESPFTPGAVVRGTITKTSVDPEVAKSQEPYSGTPLTMTIERIEPERLFSFRWHPYDIEPGAVPPDEPTTLVAFTLEDAPEGVLLTVTESGFDRIPLERRAAAFSANEQGWAIQVTLVEKYLAQKR